ncbi:MAG: hypothetical protein CR984_04430 [Proteobacteria bacterium]|nr:MAG: hypothetical protein CR984_04430 [Pseudomonadota bacterium]
MTEGKGTTSDRRIAWGRYLLVLFVATWMFVLGVLVGRGTAPVSFDMQVLEDELVAMRDAILKSEQEAAKKVMRGEIPKDSLDFHEALKKDGPDTAVEIPTGPLPASAPLETSPPDDAPAIPHKSRPVLMPKKTSLPLKKPPPGSAPDKAATEEDSLTIQVASLKDGEAADQIVANLKKAGYPAYLSRSYIPGKGLWFRVRVGRYQNRDQAAADMHRLAKFQRRKPILVNR